MGSVRGQSITVLCVDDDDAFLDLAAEMLAREPDIETVTASGGDDALDALAERPADCVVSDYDMPGMSGLDLLEAVRDRAPGLPFVLFTGKGSEEIASEAISRGVTDYLQKDVGTEQYELLANRVRTAVEHARETSQRERAEQWYRQLFEQRLVGVGISQDGVFKQANQKFADIFGYDRTAVLGMDATEFVAPEDRERVQQLLSRRSSGEVDTVRYTITALRADGERFTLEVNGGRVDYRGRPAVLGLMEPVRDRTLAGDDHAVFDIARADRHLAALAENCDHDRLAAARDALAEATAAYPERDHRAAEQTDGSATATLSAAARQAFERVGAGGDASLTVPEDAVLAADESFLAGFFEDVLAATVGQQPECCDVTVAATDTGFRVRVCSSELADQLAGDLYGQPNPRPDPVSGLASQRDWDVLITTVDEATVEYQLERVTFADDA
jgi:PAS domain S-box-containing protein